MEGVGSLGPGAHGVRHGGGRGLGFSAQGMCHGGEPGAWGLVYRQCIMEGVGDLGFGVNGMRNGVGGEPGAWGASRGGGPGAGFTWQQQGSGVQECTTERNGEPGAQGMRHWERGGPWGRVHTGCVLERVRNPGLSSQGCVINEGKARFTQDASMHCVSEQVNKQGSHRMRICQ